MNRGEGGRERASHRRLDGAWKTGQEVTSGGMFRRAKNALNGKSKAVVKTWGEQASEHR